MKRLANLLQLLAATCAVGVARAQVSLRVEADCVAPKVHEPLFLGMEIRNGSPKDMVIQQQGLWGFGAERYDEEQREWKRIALDGDNDCYWSAHSEVRVSAGGKTWVGLQAQHCLTDIAGKIRVMTSCTVLGADQIEVRPGSRTIHGPFTVVDSPWLEIQVQPDEDNTRLLVEPTWDVSLVQAVDEAGWNTFPLEHQTPAFLACCARIEDSKLSERIKDCARFNRANASIADFGRSPEERRSHLLVGLEILNGIDLDRYPRDIGGLGYAALLSKARALVWLGDLESAVKVQGVVTSRYPGNVEDFERRTELSKIVKDAAEKAHEPTQPK